MSDLTFVRAVDLQVGYAVDLEDDPYAVAPPDETYVWQYDYGVVTGLEYEDIPPHYPVVVTVMSSGSEHVIAFPRDHELRVVGRALPIEEGR